MCGRYQLLQTQHIAKCLQKVGFNHWGDMLPNDVAPILYANRDEIVTAQARWGYPSPNGKGLLINARAETLEEKAMFRNSLYMRRCALPATSFYEWNVQKEKYRFLLPMQGLFYLAGLFDDFEGERRFVVITTKANDTVAGVHHRMPVILTDDSLHGWLFQLEYAIDILSGQQPALYSCREGGQPPDDARLDLYSKLE